MSNTSTAAGHPPPGQTAPIEVEPATYTVEQFADWAQCSPRHIWRLIDLGKIPGVIRLGRLVRISRAVASSWLAGNRPAGRG